MNIYRIICQTLALTGAAGSLACATYNGPVGKITDVVVTSAGSDSPRAPCAAFSVSPATVRAFFRNAILITARQEHDGFLHGPCYVQGTLSTRHENWQWELRNGGTATLTAPSSGDVFSFADPAQASSLAAD